ncbi:MAG: hypothetical protein K1X95_11865 [Acidimicrobiia bacterium]|nr:hypothetical protein [Acidimicrobiia bacterium]
MLKRRVTESTLDTYAARMRPSDLAAVSFQRPASRPTESDTSRRPHDRPESPQPPTAGR